jgi:hypothetical protein
MGAKGAFTAAKVFAALSPSGSAAPFDRLVAGGELLGTRRVVHHGTRRAQAIDVEDEPFRAAACGHELDFGELVGDHLQPHHQGSMGIRAGWRESHFSLY